MWSGVTVVVGSEVEVLYWTLVIIEVLASYLQERTGYSTARVRAPASRASRFERYLVRSVNIAMIRLPVRRPCLMSTRRYAWNLILVARVLVPRTCNSIYTRGCLSVLQ